MAESTLAIDTDIIVDIEDGTANAAADVETSVTEIVTKFNEAFETETGHCHDGSDSKSISSGIGSLTMGELAIARIMGWPV